MSLTPEGFEPPAFGFGIRRAAIAPWRLSLSTRGIHLLRRVTTRQKNTAGLTPEGFEPPAFGFGIRRAAIAPWRLTGFAVSPGGAEHMREAKAKRTPPLGIEPRTCRLTADRSANGALKAVL